MVARDEAGGRYRAMEERRLGVQLMVLPEGTTAKQALEMVYRGEIMLSPQQMRAAIDPILRIRT